MYGVGENQQELDAVLPFLNSPAFERCFVLTWYFCELTSLRAPSVDTVPLSRKRELAVSVLKEEVTEGVGADHVAYNDAISVCCSNLQWELALELLREMPMVGLRPESSSYACCIKACSTVGQFELAVELIREMAQAELRPGIASFNVVLRACSKSKQWKIAVGLLGEMVQLGVAPDVSSYTAAIAACGAAGAGGAARDGGFEQAVALWCEMQGSGGVSP